jgi:hypothetical protein
VEWAAAGALVFDGKAFRHVIRENHQGRKVKADRVALLAGAGFLTLPELTGAVEATADGCKGLDMARAWPGGLISEEDGMAAVQKARRVKAHGKPVHVLPILPGGQTEKRRREAWWVAQGRNPDGSRKREAVEESAAPCAKASAWRVICGAHGLFMLKVPRTLATIVEEHQEERPRTAICGPQVFTLTVPAAVDERGAVHRIKALAGQLAEREAREADRVTNVLVLADRVREQQAEEKAADLRPLPQDDAPALTFVEVMAELAALRTELTGEREDVDQAEECRSFEEVLADLQRARVELGAGTPQQPPVRTGIPARLSRRGLTLAASAALVSVAGAAYMSEVVPPAV